jgi:hypothetical protein
MRLKLLAEAMTLVGEDVGYIPLIYRRISWAMRSTVDAKARPNDVLDLRFVNMD